MTGVRSTSSPAPDGVRSPRHQGPAIAAEQGGAFSRTQAIAAGWSSRQVDRRIERGVWRRVAGRAYTAEPGPDSAWRRAWAAALTWSDAVVALRIAGALHGFPATSPERADSIEPVHAYTAAARRPCHGVHAVRRSLTTDDVEMVDGLLLTTPQRTAVDLLAGLPWSEALDLFAWVSSRDVLDRDALSWFVARRRCRHGTPQLGRLLAYTRDGAVSPAEHLFHDLMRGAGIGGWTSGVTITGPDGVVAVVDVLFESARVVVEIDGWRAHGSRAAFQQDRQRQNRLVALGYRVLRFTWADLVERPNEVIDQVRRLV